MYVIYHIQTFQMHVCPRGSRPSGGRRGRGPLGCRCGGESAHGAGIRAIPHLGANPVALQLRFRRGSGPWYPKEQTPGLTRRASWSGSRRSCATAATVCCFATLHQSWSSRESRESLGAKFAESRRIAWCSIKSNC